MKKMFLIFAAGLLLTGCMKTVEFSSYSATYDTKIWDYYAETRELVMKSDEYCGLYLDAGGKGEMGKDFTYEDGENGAVVTKEKIDGKDFVRRIIKDFGDPAEGLTIVEIVPAITENQEDCIKAGYEVMNSVK